MIDTIALTLNEGMFTIVEHDKFSPSTRGLYSPPYYTLGGRGLRKVSMTKIIRLLEKNKPRLQQSLIGSKMLIESIT